MAAYREPIALLSTSSSVQLSSGQVILDPVSLVKELIENAIDAKASSIIINLSSDTVNLIQVRDNGHGIPVADHDILGKRYCTSKIRSLKDLADIGGKSLGFRGEALSSVMQLAETLEVTTKSDDSSVATKITMRADVAPTKSVVLAHCLHSLTKFTESQQLTQQERPSPLKLCSTSIQFGDRQLSKMQKRQSTRSKK
jgi:DNA mismatch repair ATPase MutL